MSAELLNKIKNDDNFVRENIEEIHKILSIENEKSIKHRDFELISTLCSAIARVEHEENSEILEKNRNNIYHQLTKNKKKNPVFSKKFRPLIACFSCVIIGFSLNMATVFAYNENVFSFMVKYAKGGLSVKFMEEWTPIELPCTEDDPFGIIAECAKYDIVPETPHYLPEGFKLKYMGNTVNEEYANTASFSYSNINNPMQVIKISYTYFWGDEKGSFGIPSDDYNISEEIINGHTAVISKEDNQFTALYEVDNLNIVIATKEIDYEECKKITDSMY